MSNKDEEKVLLEEPVSTATQTALSAPIYTPATYKQSAAVTSAQEALQKHSAQAPGAYTSKWQAQLDDTVNKILNREEFSYDVNGDACYKQYADQYARKGKAAMEDTIARASAMTGGYGNSYAQTAGQATYAQYMTELADKIPELYQLALDKYNAEGDALYDRYSLLSDAEGTDYDRYRDSVSDYLTERDYLTDRYDTEYARDYGEFRDKVSDTKDSFDVANENYRYSVSLEREDRSNAKAELLEAISSTGYNPTDEELAAAGLTREQANSYLNAWAKADSNSNYATLAERISATGYNPTDEELAAAGMTRGEAEAYGEQYSLGIQELVNSVSNVGSTSGGSGEDDPGYYPYGEYTQKEYISALMKYQDKDFGDNRAISAGGFAVSIGTPEALYLCENMTGGVSAYYTAYNRLLPEHEWQAAKDAGIPLYTFTNFETYEEYVNAWNTQDEE